MASKRAYQTPDGRLKIETALRNGATPLQAAQVVKVAPETFLGWMHKDPEFKRWVEHCSTNAPSSPAPVAAAPIVARDRTTGGDRWIKLREDAARLGPGMLGYLLAVEARLAARPNAHGFSPWWRYTLESYYRSGRPVLLACVGRGGGKSDTQTAVVVTECLFADRTIPPGDPAWIWPFLSKDMSESNDKFEPFVKALSALGVAHEEQKINRRMGGRSQVQFADAKGQLIEVRIYPNTKDALRGPTACGATHDEEWFWKAGGSGEQQTHSAEEVLTTLAGCFRSSLDRKHIRISSAGIEGGPLFQAITDPDPDLHFVARLGPFVGEAVAGLELVASKIEARGDHDGAKKIREWARGLTSESPWIPSWVGNPTHNPWNSYLLIPPPDRVTKWLQENGSRPLQEGEAGDCFDLDRIEAAKVIPLAKGRGERFAAIDTGAKRNPAALAIVERVEAGSRYQWRPILLRAWRRAPGELPLDLRAKVLPDMARLIRQYEATPAWWSDGWAGDAVEIVGAEEGIETIYVSTSTQWQDVYSPVCEAIDRGDVALHGCDGADVAVAQMRAVRRVPRREGGYSIAVPEVGTEHGELGQVLCRALAHAGVAELSGSSVGEDEDDVLTSESRYAGECAGDRSEDY